MFDSVKVFPSILEYEPDLESNFASIRKLIDLGIEWIHVDIMRHPFIQNTKKFSKDSIAKLCNEFKDYANFDFHLMSSYPDELMAVIDKNIPDSKKEKTLITLHREAYRFCPTHYGNKGIDLFQIDTGSKDLNEMLWKVDHRAEDILHITLGIAKKRGYLSGIALEPNTKLKSIENIVHNADFILFMSVHSGKGGQEFIPETLNKIKEAKELYPGKIIQVDGGINYKTISSAVKAGAKSLVIGSYLTKSDNLEERLKEINSLMN